MRICPQCRTAYTAGEKRCTRDGTPTVDARAHAEAEGDPLRGVTVAGRFQIIERIGVGGMGTVYRAEQVGLGRSVALKILKRELIFDRDTVTRFHREARAMSLLTHPNTVRVFDFGETPEGLLFLAMELLEGELLTHRLEREGPLDVRTAVGFASEILASLAEAHKKSIIHRDLKPDNIYLARVEGRAEPVVKVLDFGIAKVIQGDRKIDQLETQAGTVFGTPRYMSPEQAQGKKLDARSDLYAVGVLLYQMLTGRAPFVDDDAVVVMARHIKERPQALHVAAPTRPIPVSLARAVQKSLEKSPDARFETADAFMKTLAALLPDVDEAARLAKAGKRWKSPLATVPRGVLVGGGVALVAAVALGIAMLDGSEPRTPAVPPATTPSSVAATNAGAPAPAATRAVPVRSVPEGAEVWRDGQLVGVTPLTVELRDDAAPVRVALRKRGYAESEATVTPGSAGALVTLRAATPARNVAGALPARRPAAAGTGPRGATQGATPEPAPTTPPAAARDPYERFD
jgi:hypothetical protein